MFGLSSDAMAHAAPIILPKPRHGQRDSVSETLPYFAPPSRRHGFARPVSLNTSSYMSAPEAFPMAEKVSDVLPGPEDFDDDSHNDSARTGLLHNDRQQSGADNDAEDDIESQKLAMKEVLAPGVAAEYDVATRKKLIYLAAYFALNLGLTIYNKAVLGSFRFPWLLTVLHASCVSIGCTTLLLSGHFSLSKLNPRENLILVAFSFLFTINIAISNVSL